MISFERLILLDEHYGSILHAAGLPPAERQTPQTRSNLTPAPRLRLRQPVPKCLALIATRNFLPFAQLTAQTFLSHHPDFEAFLLLVDGEPCDGTAFPEGHVVLLSDLSLPHVGWYAAKFTASEFSNALKPVFLRYLSGFVEKLLYLDCDIAVFDHLSEMIELLDVKDLVLVPHMLVPPPRPEQFWTHPTRADIFNSGLINAGSFALNPANCGEFLAFWMDANLSPGAFYEGAGYQTDQQHLNWALVTMPGACVLRETRYNVAYWNLHERDFRSGGNSCGPTRFEVDRKSLGFFHFSGYDVQDRFRLSRHDGRHSVYNLPAVAEILDWYSDQILSGPGAHRLNDTYRFDRLGNGFRLTRFVRELLKKYDSVIPKFDADTEQGADDLCAFLMDPLPATGSMLPFVAAEIYNGRPDLQGAFPGAHTATSPSGFWRWFCRHAGKEYDIQVLIDRFRRTMASDSIGKFAQQVSDLLGNEPLRFLGTDRVAAGARLRLLGRDDMADALLEAQHEWYFFSDLGSAFEIYTRRDGLRDTFADLLGADHEAFCEWLSRHGSNEHGCSPRAGECLLRCKPELSLARIYSYLARREDIASKCLSSLLSDNAEAALRDLVRGAGDGLEYDLDDVIVLRFIHQTQRHLLVPLYLELPCMRRHPQASRIAEISIALLPEAVRDSGWARRGCEVHAACFDLFSSLLDDELHRWSVEAATPSRDVLGVLRNQQRTAVGVRMVKPAYQAAFRRLPTDSSARVDLWSSLKDREHHAAVNVFGYFHSDIGIGESTRGLAQAISMVRPVNQVPLNTGQLREGIGLSQLFQRFDHLSDTNIFVSYPHQNEDLLGLVPRQYLTGRHNIAHLAWEQKDGNPWWKVVYDRYDEIWTISDFAATPFRKMFPGRIRVVPNVLDFAQFPSCDESERGRLLGDELKFLFAFDANSSIERKNPEGLIEAFIRAFSGTPHAKRVQLTLKVGGMHRAEHAERMECLMRQANECALAIRFDGRQLPREAMLRLIAGADCYVSLHRAEGFGYTMAEAMSYGVPVIASGYSGNLEYMTPKNSFLVPCHEAFVKTADGPFQRGSVWGDPDIDMAASLMRTIAENPAAALAIGKRGQKTVRDKLSAKAVAETVKPYFETPGKSVHPLAAE